MKQNNTKTAFLISSAGIMQQILLILWNFVFRTVFLHILSKEYLGINGLFTNILQIFSLAELGIGGTILYRMYVPFEKNDRKKISAYLGFYKEIYTNLSVFVVVLGTIFIPFLKYIVDFDEVPTNINIYFVYLMFVVQSAISYLFVYKQSLVIADQKGYKQSIFLIISDSVINVSKIVLLILTKSFELMLLASIVSQVSTSFIYSKVIDKSYRGYISNDIKLLKNEKIQIFKDTAGLMCHKIGMIVVTSTDSIVLTKICGLAIVGMYSNYSLLVNALAGTVVKVFSNFSPIIGHYVISNSEDDTYEMFLNLEFANMWIASLTTICLYFFLNPFICLWLDKSYLFDNSVVIMICIQYFLQVSKLVPNVMINGCGLFMKDKVRPIIESILNLIISIILAYKIGVAGVFIGTVISAICTFYWREPYLLYKYIFKKQRIHFFIYQRLSWIGITIAMCFLANFIREKILFNSFLLLFITAAFSFLSINLIYIILLNDTKQFKYYIYMICRKFLIRR